MNRWGFLWVVVLSILTLAGCGGKDFTASQNEESDAADSSPDAFQDASHEKDAKPEADAHKEEAAMPEASPEASPEADVQPDAPLDVQPDVVAEDGPPLTDCQKWGQTGKVRVIMTYSQTLPMPAGEVMAFYGKFVHYQADGGNVSQDYAVWDTADLTTEVANVVLDTPVPAETGIDFTFEPSSTALPHTTSMGDLHRRCNSMGCPAGDSYKVCVGTEQIGGFANGSTNGVCSYQLDTYNHEQIHCVH